MKKTFKKNFLLTGLALGIALNPLSVKASNYFDKNQSHSDNTQKAVSIAVDFYSPGYSVNIFDEKDYKYSQNNKTSDAGYIFEYTTAPYARFYKKTKKKNKLTYEAIVPITVPEENEIGSSSESVGGTVGDWKIYNKFNHGNIAGNQPYFLFPRSTYQADEIDEAEAKRVENILVRDLNKAIEWVTKQVDWKPGNKEERVSDFFELTGNLANIKINGGFTFKGHDFVAIWENSNGTGKLIIKNTTTGEQTEKLCYQINLYKDLSAQISSLKQEGKTQEAHELEKEYIARLGSSDSMRKKLNWNQVVYYGNASYIATGLQSSNQSFQNEVEEANLFEQLLANVFNSLANAMNDLLGLEDFEKLMLNQTNKYDWHGVTNGEWFEIGGVFFWIFQVLAWVILLGAVVKLFTSNLVACANTFARVQLIEGVRDIMIAAFMLTLISPIFELLGNFNELFINIITNLTRSNQIMLDGTNGLKEMILTGNGLAGAILGLLYLGLSIYFNAVYMLRAFTVVLLFGLSPAFTVLYAFGGRFKALTLRFYREVVGNIFIGSFYAVAVTFYGMFTISVSSSNPLKSSLLLSFVLLWGFIPMTKLFKNLTGIGESDFISQTASVAQNKVSSAAKKHIKDPAERLGKGSFDAIVEGNRARKNLKTSRKELEEKRDHEIKDGKDCKLSDYHEGNGKRFTGGIVRTLGDVTGNKTLRGIGTNMMNNAGNVGELKYEKHGNNSVKFDAEHKGVGHEGCVLNDKGNFEHKFNGDALKNTGVLETKMTNGGAKVEQTYSADAVASHQEFFDTVKKAHTSGDTKTLNSLGVSGYREDNDGSVTVAYNSRQVDLSAVRNDGGNMIFERGSSTTRATANIAEQLTPMAQTINNKPNKPNTPDKPDNK